MGKQNTSIGKRDKRMGEQKLQGQAGYNRKSKQDKRMGKRDTGRGEQDIQHGASRIQA